MTRMPTAAASSAIAVPISAGADDDERRAIQRCRFPVCPAPCRLRPCGRDESLRVGQHQPQDVLGDRALEDSGGVGQDDVGAPGEGWQEVVDARRAGVDPLEPRRAAEEVREAMPPEVPDECRLGRRTLLGCRLGEGREHGALYGFHGGRRDRRGRYPDDEAGHRRLRHDIPGGRGKLPVTASGAEAAADHRRRSPHPPSGGGPWRVKSAPSGRVSIQYENAVIRPARAQMPKRPGSSPMEVISR